MFKHISLLCLQFYRPWELRAEEEDRIKRQIQAAEKDVENEVNEHQRRKEDKDDKEKEGQHPYFSASQVDGAQPPQEPGHEENATKEDGQPKAELLGADVTNEEQVTTESNVPELDAADDEDENIETQASVLEDEDRKQEEKTSEDHGGEELVEGQEDDVIY